MKWGNLTIFINHLMFSARRTRLLPVYWLSKHRFFCRRHYKIKFDIDPGYNFRLLLQFHSRKLNTM